MLEDHRELNVPYKVLQLKSPNEFINNIPTLDKLSGFVLFSYALKNESAKLMLETLSPIEQAYFLYKHALPLSNDFVSKMSNYLKSMLCRTKFKGGLKTNIVRIAEKIKEINSFYRITDMIRGEITVEHIDDIKEVYFHLTNLPYH